MQTVRKISLRSRAQKRMILMAFDLVAMALALWAAFSVRLGILYFPAEPVVLGAAFLSFLVGIFALWRLHVYHLVLRYFDMRATGRIFAAAALAAVAWVVLIYLTQEQITFSGIEMMVPRSVGIIYCGFLFLILFLGRYAMHLSLAAAWTDGTGEKGGRGIAIYGVNPAGISLAQSLRLKGDLHLAAFIEDDTALHGQLIAGVPVYSPKALPELARSRRVEEVLLAMPKASRSQRLSAISRLTELNLAVKTVPAPEEIMSGRYTISDLRPIDVGDLLRRNTVEPLSGLIRQAVAGRTILVTGAGGSIGSEICRQVLRAQPRKLVLFDHSEFALYSIEQELLEALEQLPADERPELAAEMGSMLNDPLVRRVIADHGIDTIYHAAAYKHVPLLEQNEPVGVENNVFGTWVLAKAAFDARLTRFTMISTDKAVRPKSVMGASKRVAELIIQGLAEQDGCATRFGIVRFGNVLDSSGSVVQRFREQIKAGGPVTVTHKDITRFFMSIPEATQLVLQASAMAEKGEVFVLDMGEPVKIADLARNMIALSGMSVRDEKNPTGDIAIEYVGLRPGEKLYEELFVGEDTQPTAHPGIQMAREGSLPFDALERHIDMLRDAVHRLDCAAVRDKLNELIAPDRGQLSAVGAEEESNVVPLDARSASRQ
ncbi:nucleoside-diphosphate sugar epimerase/dehydratase [Sphingosinicella sp. YJ22]|uniref:polysaccharide biosynthesis protein n=1 Tax=Sphingosinicella sp. YJ22 TaxID=1104780 RepID=UPI001408828F|nr:nucleoside-diphosphate sugar epimerase/dehydratase [Sphingosinicella sp. YJ22]